MIAKVVTTMRAQKYSFQFAASWKTDDIASIENKTPPIDDPKATATQAAAVAVKNSRPLAADSSY